MFKKSVATRENVKLKIGLAGPSGSGKTYSALQMAYGIAGDWSKVAVCDTENDSAKYYAGLGHWEHIPFDPTKVAKGYHPHNWVKLIEFVEQDPKTEVLILDSISHEWDGVGGILDIVDDMNKGFAGWKAATPMHNAFIDAIRLSRLHVIATMRTKTDYVVETNEKGKSQPKKVGLKVNQREGVDYEFGIVFDIAINHYATASKDRTGLFAPRKEFKITPEIGKELVTWATSGEEPKKASIYDGSEAQQTIVKGILQKKKVPEQYWADVDRLLRGKPSTELVNVIEQVRSGGDTIEGVFER
jgi:hypothetical protein